MSGDSYNVYDEQNEIRGAEMLEKYRQMHSGEHDDLDVRPSEFARDNPMTDDPRQPNAKRKTTCRKADTNLAARPDRRIDPSINHKQFAHFTLHGVMHGATKICRMRHVTL